MSLRRAPVVLQQWLCVPSAVLPHRLLPMVSRKVSSSPMVTKTAWNSSNTWFIAGSLACPGYKCAQHTNKFRTPWWPQELKRHDDSTQDPLPVWAFPPVLCHDIVANRLYWCCRSSLCVLTVCHGAAPWSHIIVPCDDMPDASFTNWEICHVDSG